MQKRNDFSKGSIPRLITRLSLPMIGAELINALYSIVDRMFIGRIPEVGKLALTGIGVTFPFLMILSAFAVLSGMGGAPLVSIARGEGRDEYAERIMGVSFAMLLIFGAALTVAGFLVKGPVLTLFGASSETFPYANDYMSVYLLGTPFVMITLGMNPFINAQGFTRTGMLTVALGAAANLVLDPVFIFVFGMGVRGAALATIISQGLSAAWILIFLTGKKTILRIKLSLIRLRMDLVKKICALGVSSFTMNLTESTVQIVCNTTLQIFGGDTYVAVMTVISSIRQVLMMPLNGFSQGVQPVLGYNYGARRYDRVRAGFKFTTLVCFCYAVSACVVVLNFPMLFINIFNSDPELIGAGVPAIRLYFCAFWMLFMQMSAQRGFVALGKSRQAIFFSLLRKAFIVAPLAYILPRVTGLGVNGVFVAEVVSDVVGSSACFITFMLTVWPSLRVTPDSTGR